MRRKIIVTNNKLLGDVEKIIATGQKVVLLTKGMSMMPFIVGGEDSVRLCRIDNTLKCGEIVLAKIENPHRYVIHRVIAIENDTITLMGDGNLCGTEICNRNSVVARVTSILKPNIEIDPNSKQQQQLAKIWKLLTPIRRYLLAIIRRLK